MTSLKQTSLFTEETLTSLQAASLVSPTQWQESDSVSRTLDIFGRKCCERFGRFDRHGSWAKTFSALLIGTGDWFSTRCRLTWKLKGTRYNRMYFQLAPSTLPIEETGSGLLLKTPAAMDAYSENLSKKEQEFGNSGTLAQEIQSGFVEKRWPGLLPTPQSRDEKNGSKMEDGRTQRKMEQGWSFGLNDLSSMGMLPTPMASDCGEKVTGKENQNSMVKITRQISGQSSQLNPLFVAEMMGFPPDWTVLPFQNGDKSQSRDTETQ